MAGRDSIVIGASAGGLEAMTALEMIAGGWGRREPAEVGVGPELLREVRLGEPPPSALPV